MPSSKIAVLVAVILQIIGICWGLLLGFGQATGGTTPSFLVEWGPLLLGDIIAGWTSYLYASTTPSTQRHRWLLVLSPFSPTLLFILFVLGNTLLGN